MTRPKYVLKDFEVAKQSPYHPDTIRMRPEYSEHNRNAVQMMRCVFVASIKEYCEGAANLKTVEETEAFMESEIAEWLNSPDFDFFCDLFNLDATRHRRMVIEEPEAILARIKEI